MMYHIFSALQIQMYLPIWYANQISEVFYFSTTEWVICYVQPLYLNLVFFYLTEKSETQHIVFNCSKITMMLLFLKHWSVPMQRLQWTQIYYHKSIQIEFGLQNSYYAFCVIYMAQHIVLNCKTTECLLSLISTVMCSKNMYVCHQWRRKYNHPILDISEPEDGVESIFKRLLWHVYKFLYYYGD